MAYLTYNGKYVTHNGKMVVSNNVPSRSMNVTGESYTLYTDGGSFLCVGNGRWNVTANAAWYITYPSFMAGRISPTSGSGNKTIICSYVTATGSGTIDFYWTSDNAYAGYSFDVASQEGGCV